MVPEDRRQNSFGEDRRKAKRIERHFILTYFDKNNPEQRFELTQLKNISKGGICFVTSKPFEQGTILEVELKTPYLSETTHLEGVIQGSTEKMIGIVYETRLQFENLDPAAEIVLDKLIEFFLDKN